MNCLVIQQNGTGQRKLDKALQYGNFRLSCRYARNSAELERYLNTSPGLLFCPATISAAQKKKLHNLLYQLAPDCIVVYYSDHQWHALNTTTNGIQVAAITIAHPELLQQQLHYLLAYAQLRTEFRHCKHLLRIVEQRSQWLVDYAREAVAYITRNQHLYVNAAYLSLFGFEAEIDALSMTVSKLVAAKNHKSFLSLSLETEQKVSLPNKLLLDMKTARGRPFRAEVRFIPSVFRGQRCIQLHVHPLLDSLDSSPGHTGKQAQAAHNPWKVRIPTVNKPQQQPVTPPAPVKKQRPKAAETLQAYFPELLNLRGSEKPALFAAQPYLEKGKEKVAYPQLLQRFIAAQRFRLDKWNVQSALDYLSKRRDHPLTHQVWVELGDWLFTDKPSVTELVKFLQRSHPVNSGLILSVNIETAMRYRSRSIKILPLLRKTGVHLALDHVTQHTPELLALLEISQAEYIRSHENLIRPTEHFAQKLSENLQQLLEHSEEAGYDIVVDGVRDINTMNKLCETNVAYLQGEVLAKFKR